MLKKIKIQYIVASIIAVIVLLCGVLTSTLVSINPHSVVANSHTINCTVKRNGTAEINERIYINSTDIKKEFMIELDVNNGKSTLDLSTLEFSYSGETGSELQYKDSKKVYKKDNIIFSSTLFEEHNKTSDGKELKKTNGHEVLYLGSSKKTGLTKIISINLKYTLKDVVERYNDYSYLNFSFIGSNFSSSTFTLNISLPTSSNKEDNLVEKVYANHDVNKHFKKENSTSTSYKYSTSKDNNESKKTYSFDTHIGMVLKSSRFDANSASIKKIDKNSGNGIKAKAAFDRFDYSMKRSGLSVCIIIIINALIYALIRLLINRNARKEIEDNDLSNKLNPLTLQLLKGTFKYKDRELLLHLIYNEKMIQPTLNKEGVLLNYRSDNKNEVLAASIKSIVGGGIYMKDFFDKIKKDRKEITKILEKDALTKNEINKNSSKVVLSLVYLVLNVILSVAVLLGINSPLKYFFVAINLVLAILLALSILRIGYVSNDSVKELLKYKSLKEKIKHSDLEGLTLENMEGLVPYSITYKFDGKLINTFEELSKGDFLLKSSVSRNSKVIEYLIRSSK